MPLADVERMKPAFAQHLLDSNEVAPEKHVGGLVEPVTVCDHQPARFDAESIKKLPNQSLARVATIVQRDTPLTRAAQIRSEKRSATYDKVNIFSAFLTCHAGLKTNSAQKSAARTVRVEEDFSSRQGAGL
jgi:hypothetical protein